MAKELKFISVEIGRDFFLLQMPKKNYQQPPSTIETNTLRSYRDERKPPNYTKEQLKQLEELYIINPRLTNRVLLNLTRKLCIHEDNIRLWYRKRRARDNSEWNDYDDTISFCSDDCEACMNLRSNLDVKN
ncbi:uncharacterized protein LOC114119907 [Aphis gossypii]|uniref:Homeobox domain-containing protein n=1 Tax=Aphis gossypii TaxID=80765 RepID=A0A9P0IXM2_APHGO|nr:uncharacterized protein LOC114119907 [Aphis gossypii]CAH1723191.1 unnamed protein product [Aphis gossypii]